MTLTKAVVFLFGFGQTLTDLPSDTNAGQLTRLDGDGFASRFVWNAEQQRYLSTDGQGAYDSLMFDATAQQWVFLDGATQTEERYNSQGRLVSLTDAQGQTTTFSYENDQLVRLTDATGLVTQLEYNDAGRVQRIYTQQDGQEHTLSRYRYDELGRLTSVLIDLTPNDNRIDDGAVYQTAYTYHDSSQRLASITHSDGTTSEFDYIEADGQWRLQQVRTGGQATTTFEYDTANRTTQVTDSSGQVWLYRYDELGNIVDMTAPAVDGQVLSYRYEYDPAGNLVAQIDSLDRAIRYGYDDAGNQTREIHANGRAIVREFDDNNQLLSETQAQFDADYLVELDQAWANGEVAPDPINEGIVDDSMPAPSVAALPVAMEDVLYRADGSVWGYMAGRFSTAQGQLAVNDAEGNLVATIDRQGDGGTRLLDTSGTEIATFNNWNGYFVDSNNALLAQPGKVMSDVSQLSNPDHTSVEGINGERIGVLVLDDTDPAVGFDGERARYIIADDGSMIALESWRRESSVFFKANGNEYGRPATLDDGRDGLIIGWDETSVVAYFNSATQVYNLHPWVTESLTNAQSQQTDHFVYDGQQLRFTVSGEGRVSEYRYNDQGQLITELVHTAQQLDMTGMGHADHFTLAQLTAWAAAQPKDQGQRTDYVYDARGQLQRSYQYDQLDANGDGVRNERTAEMHYRYDMQGRLRIESTVRGSDADTRQYHYDGLGRLLEQVDSTGARTLWSYDDANRSLTLTEASGLQRTQARGQSWPSDQQWLERCAGWATRRIIPL